MQFAGDQPSQIQAILKWDALESVAKAPKDEIFGDIKNFTAAEPVVLSGDSKSAVTL